MSKNAWIKAISAAVFLACLLSCSAGLTVTVSAEAEFVMAIPYGTPTVDGVIEEDEYGASYIMNRESAEAWVGEVGDCSVTWYVAWDEGGLYYGGTINDRTPAWRDESTHWVGLDCLELAVNPGMLLRGDEAEGIFFSCGSMKDGSVVVYRHNFADGLVSDQIIGANTGHTEGSESYTMEIYLPWSLMQIDENCTVGGKEDIHLNSTKWEPKGGARLGLLPCAIDALDGAGKNIIAFKFNGTDFTVGNFVEAVLVATEWDSSYETEGETADGIPDETFDETSLDTHEKIPDGTPDGAPADTSPVTDPAEPPANEGTADGTDAPPKKGCGSLLSVGVMALLIPACAAVLGKRED